MWHIITVFHPRNSFTDKRLASRKHYGKTIYPLQETIYPSTKPNPDKFYEIPYIRSLHLDLAAMFVRSCSTILLDSFGSFDRPWVLPDDVSWVRSIRIN